MQQSKREDVVGDLVGKDGLVVAESVDQRLDVLAAEQ